MGINKTLPCHFPLGVDFILRCFNAFQILSVMVFLFGIQIAVILYQLTQTLLHLRPTEPQVGVGIGAFLFNADAFAIVPFAAPCSVWIIVCTATAAIFLFKKSNIAFAVLVLLELAVDAVFAIFKAAPPYQNGVNILL